MRPYMLNFTNPTISLSYIHSQLYIIVPKLVWHPNKYCIIEKSDSTLTSRKVVSLCLIVEVGIGLDLLGVKGSKCVAV